MDGTGKPRVAPVCPIFCAAGIYLSIGAHTPKLTHLRANGSFALHALVGADDREFQISGSVRPVTTGAERDAVVAAIPFPSFDADDPLFELLLERAVAVTWSETGSAKQVWRAD